MEIYHEFKNISGKEIVYIYVNVQDIYEFGKENLGKGENTDFLTKLRRYIKDNIKEIKKTIAIIVINGVVIGSLSLAAIYPNEKDENVVKSEVNEIQIYDEYKQELEEQVVKEEKNKEEKQASKENEKEKTTTINKKQDNTTSKKQNTQMSTPKKQAVTAEKNNTATNKVEVKKPSNTQTTNDSTVSKTQTNTEVSNSNNTSPSNSGTKIKLNNGGVISEIDLEEYVIGVVAAEMPASFHSEALKVQAVVARTYAMKKASKGVTLINSTAHQVYYTATQMKANWGSSYNTYYNKIRNAVNATKSQVLKYNGVYIDALYFSSSNGKTELPSYVWSTDYPYLQVVSSSWDENISASKHTITMDYSDLSSKLGVTVTKDSEIKIMSRTAGDRVNNISIAGKTFTGVKVRSLLGLRSADFTITKTDSGVAITTKGFGHGVGMSQYGANGAAKSGYTYRQILSHYYSGVSLVNI